MCIRDSNMEMKNFDEIILNDTDRLFLEAAKNFYKNAEEEYMQDVQRRIKLREAEQKGTTVM